MNVNDGQHEQQRAEALRWFAIADRDVATASHCLGAVPPLLESAAYFCQQSAEVAHAVDLLRAFRRRIEARIG